MRESDMDSILDEIDELFRAGDFKTVNDMLKYRIPVCRELGVDCVLTWLTATLPAKTKLRARKRFLSEARLAFGLDRRLFDGLD